MSFDRHRLGFSVNVGRDKVCWSMLTKAIFWSTPTDDVCWLTSTMAIFLADVTRFFLAM